MNATLEIFELHRSFLEKLAISLCHSTCDSEDLIQETYIRWKTLAPEAIDNPRGMLATIMARLAINHRTSARARREIVTEPKYARDLLDRTLPELPDLSDALLRAFELVLTRMAPNERTVFLLREVFEWEYGQIGDVLEQSEANCRQLFRRAKQHVFSSEARFGLSPGEEDGLVEEFLSACQSGNVDSLLRCLHETAVLVRDGGDIGESPPPPLESPARIKDYVIHLVRNIGIHGFRVIALGPHVRALMVSKEDQLQSALLCTVDKSRITRLHHISCPTRLRLLKRICQI